MSEPEPKSKPRPKPEEVILFQDDEVTIASADVDAAIEEARPRSPGLYALLTAKVLDETVETKPRRRAVRP